MAKPASSTKNIWLTRILTTLSGWAVAFAIVYTMLLLFGKDLESLPPAINALVFTGILVPIMGNLVMPHIGAAINRWVQRMERNRRGNV